MTTAAHAETEWSVRLLGGVRVTDHAGRPVDLGPAKCQQLLAALALAPREALSVGRLVDLVWGADPPRTAQKTLQTYVGRLRKALGPAAISRAGAAYRLEIDPAAIDTWRFRRAIAEGDRAAALAEWTGAPLAGLAAEGLGPSIKGLVDEWLGAVEADLDVAVERDPAAATGRLTELVAAHPFREGLWALLMTALYRTGRQAEALDAYRRARATLVDELGVEPGPRLREVAQLILEHDDRLDPTSAHRGRAHRPPPTGTVTFGVAEVADPAALWRDHSGVAADVLTAFDALVTERAAENDGFVFTRAADSVGVSFARAADAAAWADAVHSQRLPHRRAHDVRVGLHTGDADERGGAYYGPTVDFVSRLASVGHPGQTVVSSATAALLVERDRRVLGSYAIDGVGGEHELQQLGAGTFPPLRLARAGSADPPRTHGPLIGRGDLLAVIDERLRSDRLVTLVGPGGIGKTRLALEMARRDPRTAAGAVHFVELADVAVPDDVPRALADALGVTESGGRSVLDAAGDALRARSALVVLDNCEHVIDGAGIVAEMLVQRCPAVTVLATSREGLGVPAERVVVVGPLDADVHGVELFVERARAADQAFDPGSHSDAIVHICRRLDGIPLALELAAARVRSLGPDAILERLDSSFRLLSGGRRRTVERHRTLQATIEWSYQLLSGDQRLLFARLAVFAGSFDLRAVERVAPGDELGTDEVAVVLGDLVDRSMVTVEPGSTGRRFRLLEPVRHFALDKLDGTGAGDDLRHRHAAHVRAEVDRIGALLAGPDEIDAAAELTELWPNVRSAFEWAADRADVGMATDLVRPILSQSIMRQGLGELRDWTERIIQIAGPDSDDVVADGLLWTALHFAMTQDRAHYDRMIDRHGEPDRTYARLARLVVDQDHGGLVDVVPEAVAEARRRGDPLLARMFDVFVTGNLISAGRLDDAEAHALAVLDVAATTAPPTLVNWLQYLLSSTYAIRGDTERAEALYDRVVNMSLPPRTNSPNATLAARRAFRAGDHLGAFSILRSHLDELLAVDNVGGSGIVGLEYVTMMVAIGRLEEAGHVLGFFESSGILEFEAAGFGVLVTEPAELIERDPSAAAHRRRAALLDLEPREIMRHMGAVLDSLIADA